METFVNYKPAAKPMPPSPPASSVVSPLNGDKFNRDQPILLYPSDVGINPRQASWMIFARHSITGAKLKPETKVFKHVADKTGAAGVELDKNASAKATLAANAKSGGSGGAGKGGSSNSLVLASRNIKKAGTFIGLYMPPAVNVKYQMDYSQGEIGAMGEALYGIYKDYQSGHSAWDSVLRQSGKAGQAAEKMGVSLIDKAIPGAKDLYAIEMGQIITPRTEIMFRGIGRRSFSFTFTFIPKNSTEVQTVSNIVKEFKVGMSPAFSTTGSVRRMNIPDVFSIDYMHLDGQNTYLNKIGKCYLKDMDVTYGGDKFVTYNADKKGAPPQRTTIALTFSELEIMDRTNVMDGF